MARTFNPKPGKPRQPAPIKAPAPPKASAPVQDAQTARGKKVNMIDSMNLSWEPEWDEVLDEFGITRT
jgi:hypothetical protein